MEICSGVIFERHQRSRKCSATAKADGTIAPEDDAKFGVRDSALQDQDAMITLEHFKRGDLEPMKLPPNVLAGLWAITD